MNWEQEVLKRKSEIVRDIQDFLKINSVLDESTAEPDMPFGEGIHQCLTTLLDKGSANGFTVKNLDGYAGHIEWGKGEEIIGVLCHIDVVPPGDGWTSDPFAAEIRDGRIYARGALDDKGPTMAAFHALKIVKEMNLPLSKRIRIIIGTDEESDWRCVEHYFKHEEMPSAGFAPDADFPIIYAEKGLIDAALKMKCPKVIKGSDLVLQTFNSGRRLNMVPDDAEAVLSGTAANDFEQSFARFVKEKSAEGRLYKKGDQLVLKVSGKSAHAMEPNNGVNAGLVLADFLHTQALDEAGLHFVKTVSDAFAGDTRGKKIGIACSDEISGELTLNVGRLHYELEKGGEAGINIRYPVTEESGRVETALGQVAGTELVSFKDSKPHHVPKDHELIKTLQRVYEEQTGDKAELISIGGATYARSLNAGVAFGPLFPGRPDIAHQKDEYMEIEDLLQAVSLYAQAIYELAK
ncbi:dipeptidase PepV [Bacillus swezeyi]|uniref:Dipeptidase PepV n=1 Tax=Bacillus swezeyi TaxID=1925020 RepID=A0A1R1QH61_9BACI|nr:dipeptidase PepV [Bacillus swezeyi]MEC1263072.1 dipeptidase PepV [Bacillus swezeyi]MED2930400.1 dipeptidase PepV [Bacillus swezeyi]MED2944592.1 dipeptidase PepV [Bacillus swezeyi]MED2963942.1 dipeptidase PepV [Bacillus swezeyi]MED2975194.1 dipeptidase PepV [Bacillus swezeyi]